MSWLAFRILFEPVVEFVNELSMKWTSASDCKKFNSIDYPWTLFWSAGLYQDFSELEGDVFTSQLFIDWGKCFDLLVERERKGCVSSQARVNCQRKGIHFNYFVFNGSLLVLFQVAFHQLWAVHLDTDTLADNLSWVDQIVQSCLVHGSQCSADWSLLLLSVVGLTRWLWQDFALKLIGFSD